MGISLVVLALATLVATFFGDAIYRSVLSGGQDSENDSALDKLDKEVADLTPAPAAEDPAPDGEKPAPLPPDALDKFMKERYRGDHEADKALLEIWQNMRSQFLAAAVVAKVKEKVALALQKDTEELDNLTASVASIQSAVAKSETVKQRIRFATGCGLILLTFAGAIVFVRRVRKRREEVAKVCPMCLAEGTLKPDEHGSFGPLSSVACTNVIDGAHYQECGFSFLATYQSKEKLYIPTLGHPSSGKTLWSAMVYRELIKGNFDESIEFQKIRSRSGEDFDRLVEDIIIDRVGPAATQVAELPHPLIFDFKDRDRWGRSNVLLSIFDYSGEVMQRMSLDQPQRRRALIADAYLVFCDPTQDSEPQAKEFVDFAADVQALRQSATTRADRAKLGRHHTPVAICVPKIDLLVNVQSSNVAGDIGGEVQRFYDDLSAIDEVHPPMSMALLRARSDLVVRMWDFIWPGWRVEGQVRNTFGGRYMFFPLTPVGLGELGQTDLRDRILQPYGILEPLCWLLHMNGYPVLH